MILTKIGQRVKEMMAVAEKNCHSKKERERSRKTVRQGEREREREK